MKTTTLVLFSLFVIGLLLFTGCTKKVTTTQTATTTPLDQDMAALDQAATDDASLDAVDSDLTQLQDDLNA